MNAEPLISYEEATEWLHSLHKFGQKPGLERVQWLLNQFDHPERRLAFIHVAGTNGKGSTCAYLTHMLLEAGYSVGTFTSPYLVDFRERICYNKQMIPHEDLVSLVGELQPLVERCASSTDYGSPTEFEVITVLALLYFAQVVRPSVIVWETGLGGRLDSTNVVHPLVSVITNIGMDHTDILGDSLVQIAREKAGIIKPGVPVVVGKMQDECMQVMEATASKKKSTLYQLGSDFSYTSLEQQQKLGEQRFTYNSVFRRENESYLLHMNGKHQLHNASVALMVIDLLREFYAYHLLNEDIGRGLQKTTWPGRLEVVQSEPLILLDGAHNVEGMQALTASITPIIPTSKRVHVLLAALADKPLPQMASAWEGVPVEQFYLTTFDFPRAASMSHLEDQWISGGVNPDQITLISDWNSFLRDWKKTSEHSEDILIICGSLYFIAQVRLLFSISSNERAGE